MNRIYGFGNALIDLEIQIQDDELESINIKKGNMRHISENELKTIKNLGLNYSIIIENVSEYYKKQNTVKISENNLTSIKIL